MTAIISCRTMVSWVVIFLGFSTYALSPAADAQTRSTAMLTAVRGAVKVDGKPVIKTSVLSVGSIIETTGQNSSAVVSLGKLGRVELFPDSRITLGSAGNILDLALDRGKARFYSPSGDGDVSITLRPPSPCN